MTNWVTAALAKDVSDDIQQLNINGCKVALYRCGEEYLSIGIGLGLPIGIQKDPL